jgi:uncharacterized protein (TIGR03437 family)
MLSATAWGAAPSYSAASLVNCSSFSPGPFAPNSVVALFGTELARGTAVGSGPLLPTELANTRVYVDDMHAPLYYVSPGQINLVIPHWIKPGERTLRVVHQGQSGPDITITLVDAAPGLFAGDSKFAVATHADNTIVSPETPARAGEVIVLYAIGLGKTNPSPPAGDPPYRAAPIADLAGLRVSLGGAVVDPSRILYAGQSPNTVGLYQINFVVPESPGTDPEIRVTIGEHGSVEGLKLAVR